MSSQSNQSLKRVALVTGGARRIGATICRALSARGLDVIIHYRHSGAEARSLADELNAERVGSASTVGGDLDTADGLNRVVECIRSVPNLALLVNNASSFFPTPLGEVDEATWDSVMGSNLKAPFFLSQAAASVLGKNGGSIVNLADIHGVRPLKGHPVYSIAKAGLIMLTHSLGRELGPSVRVNAVAPGAILWPQDEDDPVKQELILERTALGRQGEPKDIADAVCFLGLDAGFITGQILAVDGGRSLNM